MNLAIICYLGRIKNVHDDDDDDDEIKRIESAT